MLLRPCDVENISDFNRYYTNSWVGYHEDPDSEKILPAFVSNPGTGTSTALKFLTKKGGSWQLGSWNMLTLEDLEKHLDFGRPNIGMVDDGPTVVFLSYSTPRAPSKGLRTRDARINNFNDHEIYRYRTPRSSERYDWIYHAFNPAYLNLDEALKQLNNGEKIGVALSPVLALFTSSTSKFPVLAYKRWSIGYLQDKTAILNPQYQEYAEPVAKQLQVKVAV
jgi:hypothetical protein